MVTELELITLVFAPVVAFVAGAALFTLLQKVHNFTRVTSQHN